MLIFLKFISNYFYINSILSRSLLAACSDNDMTTVRKLLGENSGINEGTDDGDSLLSLACSAGYYELAQVLLAMSAQVEDRGQKNDCTPLMEAASAGHIDIIELLLKHGADVNAQSSTGNTPLMYACAGGHVDAVKLLLAAGANVEDHNENGHTPLMEAASAGHVSVAKILLEHGAGINTHSNEFKESALTLACYKGHLDMVRFLLGAGADQEHKTDEMHTALMEASMDGHVEVARLLLDSGAQVNMPTDSFESPLTLAACGGHVDLAMLLIERGANIEEVNDEGYTPLMEAAREGHEEMVALLLSQGANINAQTEETQETALTLACCGGFLEVADYLIKHGADIELGASTPLMEAAQEGHIELVRFLLDNNANVHAQTQTGDTALAYACENGHTDVAEILLVYCAELEHESEGGRTPLMKACRAGHLCTVKFLLGRGADVNRQTANNDHTPLSLACAGGHQAVVELLLANGADPFHKLKDNSTMLIEAAKGGHINVVQMLLDFPQSLAVNGQPINAQPNMLVNNGLQQIAPIPLKHQHNLMQATQNQTQQMMQTPPGLHDVPEAIRTSNQFQNQLQAKLDQSQIISYNEYMKNNPNSLLDPNSALAAAAAMGSTPGQQESSIIAQMRLLQIQNEGFKDGLMQGLAKAQPGLLNNTVNTASNNRNNGQLAMPQPQLQQQQQQQQSNVSSTGSQTNYGSSTAGGKQKSLLRKNRQQNQQQTQQFSTNSSTAMSAPAHMHDQDLTLSEAQQVRSQPIGDSNENINEMASILNHFDANHDEFMQKWKESLSFYNDGPPPTLLPPPSNAYIDSAVTSAQGSIYGTQGAGFNFTPLHQDQLVPQFQQQQPTTTGTTPETLLSANLNSNNDSTTTNNNNFLDINNTLATFFTDARQSGQENAFSFPTTCMSVQQDSNLTNNKKQGNNQQSTPSQTIKSPGDVSQSTAIADRPKVKPVSKKDGKYIKKSSVLTVLQQQHQQQQQQQSQNQGGTTDQTSSIPVSGTTVITNNAQNQSNIIRPAALSSINFNSSGALPSGTSKQSNIVPNPSSVITSTNQLQTTSNSEVPTTTTTSGSSNEHLTSQQLSQMAIHPKMLQKIAQRLIVDTSTNTSGDTSGGQTASNMSSSHTSGSSSDESGGEGSPDVSPMLNMKPNSNIQLNLELSDVDLAAISSTFCSQLAQVHQHVSNIIQQKPGNNNDQEHNFIKGDTDGNMQIFRIDDTDGDMGGEGVEGLYPQLGDSFNVSDVSFENDSSQETGCNLEWVDCFDEVLSALNTLPVDIPGALQLIVCVNLKEIAANCSDIDTYANLFGMNTYCKARWAEQWPASAQHQQQQQQTIMQGQAGNNQQPNSATDLQVINDEQNVVEQQQQMLQLAMITDDENNITRHQQQQSTSNQLIALDHQQLQQELSLQHLQLFNQLQNQQQPGTLPLLPVTLTDQQTSQNAVLQAMQNQALQQQIAAQQAANQQNLQQQQGSADAQQQTKFVFNVETDKTTQSLQLLFQLPTGGVAQPPQGAILTTQQQNQQQQSEGGVQVVTTQTNMAGFTQQQQIHNQGQNQQQQQGQQTIQVLPPSMLEMQAQQQHQQQCNQHQVATQTPSSNNQSLNQMPAIVPRSITTQGESVKTMTKSTAKKTEKRLKDKRFPTRPTPAGQQSNTTPGFQFTDQTGIPSQFPPVNNGQQPPGQNNIIADRTIDVDSETDSNHDTALTLACAGGHEELVELLLDRGANIEHRDKKGFTPLILASTAGHAKVVEILINRKAELEAQSERTKDTPLSLACSGGRYEVVELLLKQGANKEHRNVSDYTPLSLAASGGYVNIIKMLLNHGAEINSRTGSKLGISPLMLAAMNGHTPAVRLLLDMGSDINAQIETNRNTALTLACFQGRHEVVSLLLDRKANVEHRAKTGLTPLMEAASGGYIEVGRVLLDKGADVNAAPVPSSRDTALTIAADKGHLKFVELLLSRAAAVEVKNKKGNSPLWLAANGGHLGVVEVLYNAGADIDSQDNRKVSCLMAAFRKGHTKVVKWMVNHVSQFPSDQEMTRFISTISDKDILDKCHECVKVIRAAKETQAKKAYMNASILLRELDMEKNREEQRKAAAAKRRERKKRRKQEKREQQRKLSDDQTGSNKNKNQKKGKQEEVEDRDDSDASDSSDSDDDDEEDILETIPEPTIAHSHTNKSHHPASNAAHSHPQAELRQEKEEGDSGIDANSQGSCSSSDVKATRVLEKNNSKQRNKKKKQLVPPVSTSGSNSNRSSNSPATVITTTTAVSDSKLASTTIENEHKATNNNNRREAQRKPQQSVNRNSVKTVEKENVAPKEDVHSSSATSANKKQQHQSSQQQQQQQTHQETQLVSKDQQARSQGNNNNNNNPINNSSKTYEHYQQPINQRKSVYTSRRDTVERDDFEVTENVFYNSNSKSSKLNKESPGKNITSSVVQPQNYAKREEGWKEVVSKSSGPRSSPLELKKVQVPTHAISRVIGRAGSNINAIRAATGAHIEVEKQGKVQGDRSITIKGTNEATRQAYHLITTLIRDPDVDILQVLKKEGIGKVVTSGASGQHITISTWDSKSKPGSTTSSQDGDAFPSKKATTMVKTTITGVTNARPSNAKNIFTPSSNTIVLNSNQSVPNKSVSSTSSSTSSTTTDKRGIASTASQRGGIGNKTIISYSNATQALKQTIKNQPTQTFASRVTTNVQSASDKKSLAEKSKVMSSPKHNLPAPFTSIGVSSSTVSNTNSGQNLPTKGVFATSSVEGTASTTSSGRPVTPIGPPNRNNTPNQLASTQSTSSNGQQNAPGAIGTPIPSKMSNLQQAQAHEYSLFNDNSYGSQWDNNQYTACVKAGHIIESEPQKVDVSKAPGYRGNALSSPVSSKTSSQSTTPPSSNQGLSILPNTSMQQQQQAPQSYPSPNDSMQSNVIKSTAPIQPTQNLAVQRPVSSVNMRQMPPQIEQYSLAPGPPPPNSMSQQQQQQSSTQQPPISRGGDSSIRSGNMYDNFQQPPPQQQQHPNYYSQNCVGDSFSNPGLGPIGMSRLNPKANAFNSMPQHTQTPTGGNSFQNKGPQQQLYGMYGGNSAPNNYGSQSKLPQNTIPPYQNRAPGALSSAQQQQQQQQQMNGSGMRWGYPDLGYAASARDIMGLENGMQQLGMSSPSMSPNSVPNGSGVSGSNGNPAQGALPMSDASKTRPIGAERTWKYNTFSGVTPLELDTTALGGQGPVGSQGWGIDKPSQQNQMTLQWIQQPPIGRGGFGDELVHGTESFQPLQVDYQNLMGGGPTPPNLNYMYAPFMPNDSMVTEPTWEHDKNAWPTKWSQ
uniref:CSON003381 protein n=1 Tax=Culicoides sonorensis TaxID=179676 RepID=A0A336L5G5_CULSO